MPNVMELGETFNDPGATATDNYDGNITNNITISGSVDVNSAGTYVIAYNVTDSQGNVANQIIKLLL